MIRSFMLVVLIGSASQTTAYSQQVPQLKCGGLAGAGFGAPGPGFAGKGERGRYYPADLTLIPNAINAGPHPSKAAVIELLEDEAAFIARYLHVGTGSEELSKAGAWKQERYSGTTSLKVAGYQRFQEKLPGWAYPITETPKEGEYRYLRFAWKKPEGRGVMVQLNTSAVDWVRYYSGENSVGFAPALQVSPSVPKDWTVVTRDLWADFKMKFTLTGMAFTAMDNVAYFDHIYLGRTIENLDRVTNAHLISSSKPQALGQIQFEQYWQNLGSEDASVRMPSTWALARSVDSGSAYISERLQLPTQAETQHNIEKALSALDAPRYTVREKAGKELEEMGGASLPYLLNALPRAATNLEVHTRLSKLIEKIQRSGPIFNEPQRRVLQVIRILEQAEPKAAQPILEKIAQAKLPIGLSDEAQAIVEQMSKRNVP